MSHTFEVVYDGKVLQPTEPVDLLPNVRYRVTVLEEVQPQAKPSDMPRSVARILEIAQPLGVSDLAEQHDHYLYGLPKK
jgi:hypothetical protein